MAKAEAPANFQIEEFDPPFDWAEDEVNDTLIVVLPGFRREELRVQVASTGKLKISGSRQIDSNKRRYFSKEHLLPTHCDTEKISAKFEAGILYVKLPKVISKPSEPQEPATTLSPAPLPAPPASMPKADQQKPSPPQQEPQAVPQPTLLPLAAPMPKADQQKPLEPQQQPPVMPQPPPPEPITKADQQKPSQEVMPEVIQKPPQEEKEQESEPKGKSKLIDEKAKKFDQKRKKTRPSGIGKDEAKLETKLPSRVLQPSPSLAYREAFAGFVEGLKRKKEVVNLVLAVLFVLVLVLYVKDAIKSSSGGSNIKEL